MCVGFWIKTVVRGVGHVHRELADPDVIVISTIDSPRFKEPWIGRGAGYPSKPGRRRENDNAVLIAGKLYRGASRRAKNREVGSELPAAAVSVKIEQCRWRASKAGLPLRRRIRPKCEGADTYG